jgi:hypothetical protein
MNPWAAVNDTLTVGAMESARTLWDRSARGSADGTIRGPDVVADGAIGAPDDTGTSYATPRVACLGLICAAVLAQMNSTLHESQGDLIGVPSQARVPQLIGVLGYGWR